jgi:hypothetical protein
MINSRRKYGYRSELCLANADLGRPETLQIWGPRAPSVHYTRWRRLHSGQLGQEALLGFFKRCGVLHDGLYDVSST